MAIAQSKVTAQGQISVPAEVRRKFGIGAGSVLEWAVEDEKVLVRVVGRHSSEQIHHALFHGRSPIWRSLVDLKEGAGRYIRKKHARC